MAHVAQGIADGGVGVCAFGRKLHLAVAKTAAHKGHRCGVLAEVINVRAYNGDTFEVLAGTYAEGGVKGEVGSGHE